MLTPKKSTIFLGARSASLIQISLLIGKVLPGEIVVCESQVLIIITGAIISF